MENSNSPEYLNKITAAVIDNLRQTGPAPSVQMQDVPRKPFGGMTDEEEAELDDLDEDENKDTRITPRLWDKSIENPAEYEPSDDENLAARNGVTGQNGSTNRIFDDHGDKEADKPSDPANGATKEDEDTAVVDAPDPNDDTIEDIQAQEPAESTSAPADDATKEASKAADTDGDVDMADSGNADDTPIKKEDAEAEAAPATSEKGDEAKAAEEASSDKPAEATTVEEKSTEPSNADEPVKEAETSDAMDVDTDKKPDEKTDDKEETKTDS